MCWTWIDENKIFFYEATLSVHIWTSECQIVVLGHKWISKYIWDAHNSPNEYLNIFWWLKIVWMNIQIYLGGKKVEYIWIYEYSAFTITHEINYDWIQWGNIQPLMCSFFYNNSSNQSEEQDLAEIQPTHHTSLIPIFNEIFLYIYEGENQNAT